MRRTLLAVYFLLVTVFISACQPDILPTPAPTSSPPTVFFVYRFELPAIVGYSEDLQVTKEIPFSYPVNCGLDNTFPAPVGQFLAIELSCANGQTVLFLDTATGMITLPFTDTDSHFLAWRSDGKAAYLKVNSLSDSQVICASIIGPKENIPISEFTYDLSVKPNSHDFIFTLSRGLGQGSELYLAKKDGQTAELLYADQGNYISYARFSPDGKQIAFIKTPDSQTPFTVGELWVMDADGLNPRKLADADAGHGYAANWSADGKQIAFVIRENPTDENADISSEALVSNVDAIVVQTGKVTQITNLTEGRTETPQWSPQGNTLAFTTVINGRMTTFIADVATGEIKALEIGSTCCPAWMRK